MRKALYLILLGPPGAGKGTQAATMAAETGLAHIATGDLFREAIREGGDLGKQVKVYYDRGELVPDELTIRTLLERLERPDCQKGCLLDGFPRTLEQARALDEALKERGQAIDKVLYIKVSEEEVISRLGGRWICRQCGAIYHEQHSPPKAQGRCDKCNGELYQRDDDKAETVRNRLAVYTKQTAPLIEYYTKAGKLVEVNGGQDADLVGRDLLKAGGL